MRCARQRHRRRPGSDRQERPRHRVDARPAVRYTLVLIDGRRQAMSARSIRTTSVAASSPTCPAGRDRTHRSRARADVHAVRFGRDGRCHQHHHPPQPGQLARFGQPGLHRAAGRPVRRCTHHRPLPQRPFAEGAPQPGSTRQLLRREGFQPGMGCVVPARRHPVGAQHRLRRWWQVGGQHQLEQRRAVGRPHQRRSRTVAGLRRVAAEVRQQRRDRHPRQPGQPVRVGNAVIPNPNGSGTVPSRGAAARGLPPTSATNATSCR